MDRKCQTGVEGGQRRRELDRQTMSVMDRGRGGKERERDGQSDRDEGAERQREREIDRESERSTDNQRRIERNRERERE